MTLSIVTINYNNVAGLTKTIASVLSQTWKDFEWIVVDGGSTDEAKS
jgi:glycosyltransferase involved in cell wall biosynthesis